VRIYPDLKYELLNYGSIYNYMGKTVDKRQIRRVLKKNGYSDKAVKAILRWYE